MLRAVSRQLVSLNASRSSGVGRRLAAYICSSPEENQGNPRPWREQDDFAALVEQSPLDQIDRKTA
jgi:hypothetical protein